MRGEGARVPTCADCAHCLTTEDVYELCGDMAEHLSETVGICDAMPKWPVIVRRDATQRDIGGWEAYGEGCFEPADPLSWPARPRGWDL